MSAVGHVVNPDLEVNGSPKNIYTAKSVDDIRVVLGQLNEREAAVTARLDALVASQRDFARELGRLDISRAHLGGHVVAARTISNGVLSDSASTARRISAAVKRLDLEQSRVKATLDVVEQVSELKSCVLGVVGSMGAPQDWEKAAGYISRASRIPKEIVDGQFAEEIVPTAEVPDPPRITLETAAESLCGLFLREFEKAAKESDGAKITRFFKLFPLIGRHEVGLDVYGRYVCQGVVAKTRANLNAGSAGNQRQDGFFYANTLTKLFEHIAQIVEGHGVLVERHYGPGSMIRVIERLQREADIQGGLILDTWSDERNVDRLMSDVKSYAFTFLVQSFLPQQRPSGTSRTSFPGGSDSGPGRNSGQEDEGVDLKDVDGLLSELMVMLGRWSLYCRFLARKCKESADDGNSQAEESSLSMPSFLLRSALHRKLTDRLLPLFNTMTTFFFRRSVEKAFQLDEQPPDLSLSLQKALPSNPPYITSAVDDVMYIVDKILQRSLTTSQRDVIANVVPSVGRVLSSDFVGMTQRKMRDECYPKAVVQGGQPPEDKIIAFLVLINNLDLAAEYLKRIVQSRQLVSSSSTAQAGENDAAKSSLDQLFPFEHDAIFVADSLKTMENSFQTKTSELLNDGIYVTFNQVIKPRLRPIVANAFRDIDYLMEHDDNELANANGAVGSKHQVDNDEDDAQIVKHRFERMWEGLMTPLRRILTERNFDRLLTATATYLNKVLEKRIWSYHGRVNELGAVRLERDIANVVNAVVKAGGKYSLRDAFLRCTQICLVLTMEEDEWEDLDRVVDDGGGGGGKGRGTGEDEERDGDNDWNITREERLRARAMLVR